MADSTDRTNRSGSILIILGGLPGTGKTTIARELACQLGAVHVRIDSIEQVIKDAGVFKLSLDDLGYRIAYTIAEDNLRLGRIVIADSVNPLNVTRKAWLDVAKRVHGLAIEVEVICSDAVEHRRRVQNRTSDIRGLKKPTWQEVLCREYDRWEREHIVVDTACQRVEDCVGRLREVLAEF